MCRTNFLNVIKYNTIQIFYKVNLFNVILNFLDMLSKDYFIGTNQQIVENYKKRTFLVCNSCFWCTSYFKNQISFHKCPSCSDTNIECVPIGDEERYSFNHSPTRGIELIFSNNFTWWVQTFRICRNVKLFTFPHTQYERYFRLTILRIYAILIPVGKIW
jgi:hypothetical protein